MDSFGEIRQRVDSYKNQEEGTARIHELLAQEVLSYYELGALLVRHKMENWITPQLDPAGEPKPNAFECWVQVDLRIDLTHANRLMSLYDAITEAGLTEDDLAGVGWSAMVTIKPVLTKRAGTTEEKREKAANIRKLLKLARVKAVALLKVEVDRVLGRTLNHRVAARLSDSRVKDPLARIREALDVILAALDARPKLRTVDRLMAICNHIGEHYAGIRFVYIARDEDGNSAASNFAPDGDHHWFVEEIKELQGPEIVARLEGAPVEDEDGG